MSFALHQNISQIKATVFIVLLFLTSFVCASGKNPNVLIIIGDDCTCSDLPLHGGENIKTPNIDRLAQQGMQFTHAYVSMSICMPCRSSLYTGLYPHRNGSTWNHSAVRPGTKSICHYLGKAGYRVGLTGKYHVAPQKSFLFEIIPGFEPVCVKQTADHDVTGIDKFIKQDTGKPFCLVVALVTPHVPWSVGNPDHFKPKKLKLPAYLADTKLTRQDYAKYLAEVEVMDQQVGDVLNTLDKSGRSDNTLVIFTSEQGAQFPGCKWTNWEQGLHTAFVVRWPGKVKPNSRTDSLIQYVDVLPTLLEVAGVKNMNDIRLDGRSFQGVLLEKKTEHRSYVYAMHNNVPEGAPYPIRSVRDRHFRYIRNLKPDETYIERHLMGRSDHNPYWATWMFAAPVNKHAYAMIHRFMHRPAEQLYNTTKDPNEFINLANDPKYAKVKSRLSAELDRWMTEQKDPGIKLDTREAWNNRRQAAGLAKKRK